MPRYTLRLLSLLMFCWLVSVPQALRAQTAIVWQPTFNKNADNSWQVRGDGYTATVNAAGYLASFKLGAVETVGTPFAYQPRANLVADSIVPNGDTLQAHLKGNGEATIDYQFRRDGFTITPTWKGGGYGEFQFNASTALLGIELLNDKSVTTGGDATHFVEHGEIRGVPAVPSNRNQMVRFHYPGFNLHAYVQAWGAPFNYESAGSIHDYSWGRPLLEANKPFPIIFTIQRQPAPATLAAPAFVPRTDKVSSLYYDKEPCIWNIDLGPRKAYQYLLDAGITHLKAHWSLTDIHDTKVLDVLYVSTVDVDLKANAERTVAPVTLTPPGTGYYQALFTLSEPSGKMLSSSFLTRFTVIHSIPGMVNRDDSLAGKNLSDYAIVGMIGIGGIRESHNIGEFFSDQPQNGAEWVTVADTQPPVWMNIKRLDDLFNDAATESQKYKLTWFFQANSRPAYANPANYEAMAYALVARYKDRNSVWEVENEPNFGYTPENYINQCVIPFAKGAKRADPTCHIMGPGCVSLSNTLRFMDTIYSMGAQQWLDNISTHTYPGPGESWEQFGNLGMLAELRHKMQAHGDGNKSLWQTEQGYAWDNAPRGQSARYAVRQFLQGWRNGITPEHQYYFYPHAHGFESWYQAGGGEQGSSEAWTPIGAAQRFLAENTFGMKYVGDVPSPYKGVYMARFSGATEDVIAAWTMDFSLNLPLAIENLTSAANYTGNSIMAPDRANRTSAGQSSSLHPFAGKHLNLPVPLSGDPVYFHIAKGSAFTVNGAAFGRNLASAEAGSIATASSQTPDHPASFANDGNWEQWEDVPGIKGRTAWKSGQKDPTSESPDWLQITFPFPRTINRFVALCYLPAVNPSPRDWEFQADVNGQWRTLASAKDDWTWAIEREFAPVTTSKIRLVVTGLNDGWQGDRRWIHVLMGPKATNYTDSHLLVSELEVYGPAPLAELKASLTTPQRTAIFTHDTMTLQVSNKSNAPLQGNIHLKVPPGWTMQPAQLAVKVGAHQSGSPLRAELTSPPTIPTGSVPIDAILTDNAGKTLEATRLKLEIASPVEITPQMPTILDATAQPLAITLKNVTDKPLSGTVTVAVSLPGIGAVPAQTFGPLAAQASMMVNFKVPNLKLVGAPARVTYSVTANGLTTTADQNFALRGWQVLGPYPSANGTGGFDTVYEPENVIDFNKDYALPDGPAARWKPAFDQASGFVDLAALFQPNNNVVAYATIYVKSLTARPAIFSVGSDDGIKAWINGKVRVSDNASRGAAPGQDEAPVNLQAGWNQVLLKITQGGYGWGFYFDLLDAKHQPMRDLVYAARRE